MKGFLQSIGVLTMVPFPNDSLKQNEFVTN